jgi:hypothetical protein
MSKAPNNPKVSNLDDLLAVAYQIEIDAVERYNMLADQMEAHNNPELVNSHVLKVFTARKSVASPANSTSSAMQGRLQILQATVRKRRRPAPRTIR